MIYRLLVLFSIMFVPSIMAQSDSVSLKIEGIDYLDPDYSYIENKKISIKCTFENISDTIVNLTLDDHDDYHGTLAFPAWISATLLDANRDTLADNYTSYYIWSTIFEIDPGDVIRLQPGEQVIRKMPLKVILGGSKVEFTEGDYYVRIFLGEIVSNEFHFRVEKEEN